MAKYVLLEFDEDSEADAFTETMGQNGASVRTAGVYKKPTIFCDCPNPGDKSVLGNKWNWWVHKGCGRPKKGQWQSPRNLLKPDEKISGRRQLISIAEPRA